MVWMYETLGMQVYFLWVIAQNRAIEDDPSISAYLQVSAKTVFQIHSQ
jgi:hypothetical protein